MVKTSFSIAASDTRPAAPAVISYADADPALRAQMDQAMEQIDRDPYGFDTFNYGAQAMTKLGKVFHDLIRVQDETMRGSATPVLLREIEALERVRQQAVRDISIHLGTADEILRRYDEVYTNNTYSPTEVYRDFFKDQCRALEKSHATGLQMAQSLGELMDAHYQKRKATKQPTLQ